MRRFSLILLLLLLLPAAGVARAAEAEIRDLTAHVRGESISVGFRLAGAFDSPEIRKAIESGIPTVLAYEIELIRKRPNWFDDTVSRTRIEVIATYNSITREYLVNYRRDRRLVSSEIVSSMEELRERLTAVKEADLLTTEGRRYWKLRVRVRAELMRRYLWYVIPYDVSTGWAETRVTLPGGRR